MCNATIAVAIRSEQVRDQLANIKKVVSEKMVNFSKNSKKTHFLVSKLGSGSESQSGEYISLCDRSRAANICGELAE